MPYIDCKLTETLDEEKREAVKTKLGRAISLLHKPESYLMVGFTEGYALYFAGKKLEKGAYVAVSLFGAAAASDCEKMTAAVCDIPEEEIGIPARAVYVTYHPVENWGWDGANF